MGAVEASSQQGGLASPSPPLSVSTSASRWLNHLPKSQLLKESGSVVSCDAESNKGKVEIGSKSKQGNDQHIK